MNESCRIWMGDVLLEHIMNGCNVFYYNTL